MIKKIFFILLFFPVIATAATTTDVSISDPEPLNAFITPYSEILPVIDTKAVEFNEIPELRTLYSRTYQKNDTQYQLKLYSDPIFREALSFWDRFSVFAATSSDATDNKDSKLRSGSSADTNYGSDDTVQVGYWSGEAIRPVYEWTLPDIDGTITEVTLNVYDNGGTGGTVTGDLHELTQTFTELGVTWNKYDGSTAWASPGGDFEGTVIDSVSVPNALNAYVTWYLQGGTADNSMSLSFNETFSLLLKMSSEGGAQYSGLATKETAGTSQDPYLLITYTPGTGGGTSTTTDLTDEESFSYVVILFIGFFLFLISIFIIKSL